LHISAFCEECKYLDGKGGGNRTRRCMVNPEVWVIFMLSGYITPGYVRGQAFFRQ